MIDPPKIRPDAINALKSPLPKRTLDKDAAARALFENEDAYGASLLTAALNYLTLDELGSFAPYTIRLELSDALSLKAIDSDIFDRLMAAVTIVTTDLFYQDLPAFIDICNILGGTPPDPDIFDPADAYEVTWAVTEARLIDGLDGEIGEDEFSPEIRAYMGVALADEGFFSVPSLLPMAVMEDVTNVAESFADSGELIPSIMEGDLGRHQNLEEMVTANLAELVSQLESVRPGIMQALKQPGVGQ